MPLVSPNLDDRSYAELRDELVRRIPVYTPEWTDHSPSDPGIVLLELFAYLGENLLYRFNQLPDTTRLAFLRLLQMPMRPPGIARGMAQLGARVPGAAVPAGTVLAAGKVPFTTLDDVVVTGVEALAVVREPAPLPDDEELRAQAEAAIQARGLADGEVPVFYAVQALVPAAVPGEDPRPLDPSVAVDGLLWVALLAPEDADPTTLPALRADLGGARLSLGMVVDPVVAGIGDVDPCPGAGSVRPAPTAVWRASGPSSDPTQLALTSVVVDGDTTAGVTRTGVVQLRLPELLGVPEPPDPAPVGMGELPPELGDDRDARVLAWLQVGRADPADRPIARLAWVGADAASIEQHQQAPLELVGVGTGAPGQVLRLAHRGVVRGSLVLDVDESGSWVRWAEIDDLAASPAGRHYLLDLEAGELRFGDGVRGRVPDLGRRIRATYRHGGGVEGNVPPEAVSKLLTPGLDGVTVTNPLPTRGGSAAETLTEALERIPGELRRRDRAVTSGDFRELALATPGAAIGRAETLPRWHPKVPGVEAAGVVTVVVWPQEDLRHPTAPMPDRDQIRAVCRWLDDRRLVTTELYVVPPTYRAVSVAVGVHVKPGHSAAATTRWVDRVIRQYLGPLPPDGPDGGGWPMGRRVHGPELEAAALQVDGVEYLDGLRLAERRADGSWDEVTTVPLAAHEVVEVVEVTVVQGEPLEPGVPLEPVLPPGLPVPVPVERDTC
jgi:predicted phage baseplate assembly protein